MAVGFADEWAPAGVSVNLPELRIVPAEHADEPLHAPREEGGAQQELPVPGTSAMVARPAAIRLLITDSCHSPPRSSFGLGSD
jgi:hypothetical protein